MAEVTLSESNWEEEVIKSNIPVMVDFWATWCKPCIALEPVLEEIEKECKGIKIVKLNVEKNQETQMKYSVMSVPTMLIFKNGIPVDQITGKTNKLKIMKAIEEVL